MRITTRLALGFVILTACAARAEAQMLKWEDRGYGTFSFGVQPQSRTFTESSTLLVYDENASLSVPHTVSSGVFIDISGGVRVWRNLGAGIGFSRFSDQDASTITAEIPNPLFFSRPRTVTVATGDLDRSESAIHLQLLWMLPVSNKIEVAAFGGPSFFTVTQGLATISLSDIVENAPPPFGTVAVNKATVNTASKHATGFNLGVDGTYLISTTAGIKWGAGGFIRFSGASVEFALPSGATVTVDAGGFQMGGGLRVRF